MRDATKLLGLSQQEVTQVTFGVKDPEKIDASLEASQSLDLDWQSLRVVEDRKAFDQMKGILSDPRRPGTDHDDRPPSDGSRCPIALTQSLDTGADPRNRGALIHWEEQGPDL